MRARALVIALLLPTAALLAGLSGAKAGAHATLERSTPADRAQLTSAPAQVDLYFGQQLVQSHDGTFASVLDPTGRLVSAEARIDPADGRHLVVPLHGSLDAG